MPGGSKLRNLPALLIIAAAAFAVSALRAPLYTRFSKAKIQEDVFALPPAKQVVAMSLGYRSALADLIFAHVLVASGLHIQERRPFEFVGKYLETVTELDPKFDVPYRMADGLITLQAKAVGPDAYRQARRIVERGMAEFPFDQALWASAGQFFAYIGPGVIVDPKEQDDWKLAGGRALARACELVGTNDKLPSQCIVAAGMLTRAGASEASQAYFERVLASNDDPDVQRIYAALLAKMPGATGANHRQAHRDAFQRAWGGDLSFVSRGALLTVGPAWDPAACAAAGSPCATSWRAWAAEQERVLGTTSPQD